MFGAFIICLHIPLRSLELVDLVNVRQVVLIIFIVDFATPSSEERISQQFLLVASIGGSMQFFVPAESAGVAELVLKVVNAAEGALVLATRRSQAGHVVAVVIAVSPQVHVVHLLEDLVRPTVGAILVSDFCHSPAVQAFLVLVGILVARVVLGIGVVRVVFVGVGIISTKRMGVE